MKSICILFVCLFISTQFTNAQGNIDSLKNQINAGTDTNKIEIYYTLFWEYLYRDLNEAKTMADSVFAVANQMDYYTGQGMAHDAYMNIAILQTDFEKAKYHIEEQKIVNIAINNVFAQSSYHQSIAHVYYYQSDFDSAAFHFNEAAQVYKELEHLDYYSRMLVNVGGIYQQIGELEKAIQYFIDAEEVLNSALDDLDTRFIVANNIALIFLELNQLDNSFIYIQKSLKIAEQLNSAIYRAKVYRAMGSYYLGLSDYTTAEEYYLKSSNIQKEQGLPNGETYLGLANVYFDTERTELAEKNYELAKNEFEEDSNDNLQINALLKLADLHHQISPSESIDYAAEALLLLDRIRDKGTRLLYTYELLQKAYYYNGEFKIAQSFIAKYKIHSDSLFKAETELKVLDLEKKYNNQQQELRIVSLENEQLSLQRDKTRHFIWTVIIFGLLVLILLVVVFRLRTARMKKALLDIELDRERLQKEMSMHQSKHLSLQSMHQKEEHKSLLNEIEKMSKHSPKANSILKSVKVSEKQSDSWGTFMKLFSETNPQFLERLKSEYPKLTLNDIKICVLIKSNISIRDIAELLNISERGVYTSRYRIKKKLNLPKEESIGEWLNGFK